jgi:MerR family redox-sensitive transcriptional activator SoxR
MLTKNDTIPIGELALRSGVSTSALRFYEDRELIRSFRTAGNQRRYRRDTLRRVGIIRAAQAVGISLKRIQRALDGLPASRTPTQKDWERLGRHWEADLDERIARLERIKLKLAGCILCGCLSMDGCPLYNPDDRAAQKGAGAHGLPPLRE